MSSGALAWGWEEWQAALADAYFQKDPSTPWSLFIDVEEAARLWPALHEPATQLAACVSSRIDWRSRHDPFLRFVEPWRRWRAEGATVPPPNLPVLAVSVLAAAAMHRDERASSSAYYLRLAQLLRPELDKVQLSETRDQLSSGFDPVAAMWKDLSEWVESRADSLGANTIRTHETFHRVGYPISQALVRRSDRMILTHFFSALDVLDRGVPDSTSLLHYLYLWCSRARGLSNAFVRALRHPGSDKLLGDYVHKLALSWDGIVLTARGRRQLDLRIRLDLDAFLATWAIPRPEGGADIELSNNGLPVKLTVPEYGHLYEVEGALPDLNEAVRAGEAAIRGSQYDAIFRGGPLLIFRGDPDAEWLSVDSMEPYERHVLAISPDLRQPLETVLTKASQDGWRSLRQSPDAPLIRGRLIYANVILTDAGAFQEAVTGLDPALVSALRPDPQPRPRLVHGLRVAEKLGPAHYLVGGAPDLLLPAADEPRFVEASLDGVGQSHPFKATGFPIPLRRLGLELGRHRLMADEAELEFSLHEGEGLPVAQEPDLGWVPGDRADGGTSRTLENAIGHPDAIVGAFVPGSCSSPLQLRRSSREFWTIDRHGKASAITPPPVSDWYGKLGLPAPLYWEFAPPADAVWFVERDKRRQALFPPQRLHWEEPNLTATDGASQELWAQIAEVAHGQDGLLNAYIRAWRGQRHAR